MVRFISCGVLIVLNFILQSSVFGPAAIFGVLPDTALIFTVSCGMLRGDVEGALFGLFAGLLHDLSGGYFIGFHALIGFLVGYASGKPFRDFFRDNFFLPFFIVVIAMFAKQLYIYFGSFLFRGKTSFFYYSREIILPKTIYTAAIAVPLYIAFHSLNSRIERFENAGRRLFNTGRITG